MQRTSERIRQWADLRASGVDVDANQQPADSILVRRLDRVFPDVVRHDLTLKIVTTVATRRSTSWVSNVIEEDMVDLTLEVKRGGDVSIS